MTNRCTLGELESDWTFDMIMECNHVIDCWNAAEKRVMDALERRRGR